ncbi:TPA: hypothetical protein ACH3X1_007434 [Trebouxia sp. C0004]
MSLATINNVVPKGAVEAKAILNGPLMNNELGFDIQRIEFSPKIIIPLKILDGLTFSQLASQLDCHPQIRKRVSGAAAFTIRRIWVTRLSIYRPVAAVQPTTATLMSWVGQLCTGCSEAAPDGWLPCNGQAVSRELYSQLFEVIKSAYGDGDGQTTFNVPNLQGRVAVGQGSEGSGFEKVGSIGCEVAHKLEEHEMPAHTHHLHDPGHRHHVRYCGRNYTAQGGKDSAFGANALGHDGEGSGVGDTDPEPSHISLDQAGSGVPHNNMPPFIVICYFIRW